jgi:hypothetical protein
MIGEEVTEAKLEGLIAQVDKNNTRAIEFQEFLLLLSEIRKGGGGALGNVIVQAKHGAGMSALLRDLEENPVECCSVKTRSKDMTKWKVLVRGPDGTPYEGGIFKLAIDIPDEFPFAPPDVVHIPAYPIFSTRLARHIPVFHGFLSFLSFLMTRPSILCRVSTMSM